MGQRIGSKSSCCIIFIEPVISKWRGNFDKPAKDIPEIGPAVQQRVSYAGKRTFGIVPQAGSLACWI